MGLLIQFPQLLGTEKSVEIESRGFILEVRSTYLKDE